MRSYHSWSIGRLLARLSTRKSIANPAHLDKSPTAKPYVDQGWIGTGRGDIGLGVGVAESHIFYDGPVREHPDLSGLRNGAAV
ncbi:MAG TPA: hypothetical protein VF920_06465 [Dongiaceae bacterium]